MGFDDFRTSLFFLLPTPNTTVNYTGQNFKCIMITGCCFVLANRMAGTDRRQEAAVEREHEHEGTEGRRRWAAKLSRRSTPPRSSPEMYSAQHQGAAGTRPQIPKTFVLGPVLTQNSCPGPTLSGAPSVSSGHGAFITAETPPGPQCTTQAPRRL